MKRYIYECDDIEEITQIQWDIDTDEEIREVERKLGIYYDVDLFE